MDSVLRAQENYGGYYSLAGQGSKNKEEAAGQFEAIFYRMFFQQMRNAQLEDPLFGGHAMEQLQTMQDDELASHLGNKGQLGIKDMILKEIKRQNPEEPIQGLLKDREGEVL